MIDAQEFIIWAMGMHLDEVGRIFTELCEQVSKRNFEFAEQFPFVGRIYSGTAKRPSIPPSRRRQVLSAGKCAYCNSTERLVVDHIKPYSKGGTHDLENLQCLCWPCNSKKGAKV